MSEVTSKDGTSIAYDQVGEGPAVILIGGGPTTRVVNTAVADLLAPSFSVFNYDRRGHGDSGDTAPYTVDREFEDLAALITAAGGSASVYGTSGGGIIALEAAARGLAITRLVVWEPPYIVDDSRPPVPADYLQQLTELLAADRRGDMLELFFTRAANLPAEFVSPMRQSPFWPAMEDLAPTLVHDAMLTGDFSLPTSRIAAVTIPTLVLDGGTTPWLSNAARAVTDALPDARHRTLHGQPHNVDPAAIAPALAEFFAADDVPRR
ncbi:alpha-beta hydrolase superfamily lysophospholipase [Asanoa ferruginea]|uniref:Alpha-beta hydrolase superfamily lysophospholipase n=1 Tax=Asanoa ferruginea TaxID=53367 RepID=A0A3D9ZZ68_9ACTN|nr:alpha/beta hydrolase [Asanoa ferruginea]REG01474.1 alpha-beta hydrolase superfamily lysophospholipase [Asanoa ferruginea]GIF47899.1 alpha/beta hydrolase [Asanoa ferruginea]